MSIIWRIECSSSVIWPSKSWQVSVCDCLSVDIFCRFYNNQKPYGLLKILPSILYMTKPLPKDEISSDRIQVTLSPSIMKLVAKFLRIIGMMYRDQELVLQISTTDFSGFCESWLVTMYRLSYRGRHQIIIICL